MMIALYDLFVSDESLINDLTAGEMKMGELLRLKKLANLINTDYYPQQKFFGLSQLQIDWIWQNQFSCKNLIFSFVPSRSSDLDMKSKIPLLQEIYFVLDHINQKHFIKTTATGGFNRSFVYCLYLMFYQNEQGRMPRSEQSVWQIVRLKFLLLELKLIRYENKKYILTLKGKNALDNIESLYEELIECMANKWNWAQADVCPELNLIQDSSTYCLYHLFQSTKDWRPCHEIGFEFLKAFPFMGMGLDADSNITAENCILIYCIRFLDHFCVPLGLVDERERSGKYGVYSEYRVSNFLKNSMQLY